MTFEDVRKRFLANLDAAEKAAPVSMREMFDRLLEDVVELAHRHDTRVTGLLNANSNLVAEQRADRRKREKAEATLAVFLDGMVVWAQGYGMTEEDVREALMVLAKAQQPDA